MRSDNIEHLLAQLEKTSFDCGVFYNTNVRDYRQACERQKQARIAVVEAWDERSERSKTVDAPCDWPTPAGPTRTELDDAIRQIESCAGFDDEDTLVGAAWSVVLRRLDSVQQTSPCPTCADIYKWCKRWWGDDEWRENTKAECGPDLAHLLRGVADMVEYPPAPRATQDDKRGRYSPCGGCSPEGTSEYAACATCPDRPEDPAPKVERQVLSSILEERKRQDEKWGEQNHDPSVYLTILMEEVGEYAEAVLQTRFGGNKGGVANMKREAVQVAAVAQAIVECLERGKWDWMKAPKKDD